MVIYIAVTMTKCNSSWVQTIYYVTNEKWLTVDSKNIIDSRTNYHDPCLLLFQAHMQARYVILRVLLEAGENLVQLTSTTGSDGRADVLISLDRTKIESVGRPAIGKFLRKLQVRRYVFDRDLIITCGPLRVL